MHPQTRIGRVCLVTRRADVLLDFYRRRIGLRLLGGERPPADGSRIWRLGAGGRELVHIEEVEDALPRGRTAGLFHLAIRLPTRPDLAARLRHLLDTRTPLDGTADHQVSEAMYLADPDGNGIEIYRDRPRESWFFEDGTLKMGTYPLDVGGLLGEAPAAGAAEEELPPGADLGHVHLRVRDIRRSEEFYTRVLGFRLMLRYGSAAGFVSAGGYHHHIGYNTWGGPVDPAPERPAVGLKYFSLRLPDREALEEAAARLAGHGTPLRREEDRVWMRDPSNLCILLET
jgi:catechol 2,3-dioxygenase